jgi:hypothetical protein
MTAFDTRTAPRFEYRLTEKGHDSPDHRLDDALGDAGWRGRRSAHRAGAPSLRSHGDAGARPFPLRRKPTARDMRARPGPALRGRHPISEQKETS